MVLNRRARDFHRIVFTLMGTEDGKKLLKYLKEDILDISPVADDVHKTFYNIGQQDLVKQLIELSKLTDIDDAKTVQYETQSETY